MENRLTTMKSPLIRITTRITIRSLVSMEKSSADVTDTPPVESSPSRPPLPSDARRPLRQRAARGRRNERNRWLCFGEKKGVDVNQISEKWWI